MKYAKMLGLLAIAAAALMAFAGTASATLTDGAGNLPTTIKATSTGTELTGTINIACSHSVVEGTVTSNTADHAAGTVSKLTFGGCGNHTVVPINEGKGSTLTITDGGAGSTSGTLFSDGAEVTVLTHSLFLGTQHCIYVTNDTHIGSVAEGTKAKLTIASAPIEQSATGGLCGNDAEWDGSYEVTDPHVLNID